VFKFANILDFCNIMNIVCCLLFDKISKSYISIEQLNSNINAASRQILTASSQMDTLPQLFYS